MLNQIRHTWPHRGHVDVSCSFLYSNSLNLVFRLTISKSAHRKNNRKEKRNPQTYKIEGSLSPNLSIPSRVRVPTSSDTIRSAFGNIPQKRLPNVGE